MSRIQLRAFTVLSAGLLLAATVWAQPPGAGRGERIAGGDGPRHRGAGGRLVQFLELTDEQKDQWKVAHEDHAGANRATHEQQRENRAQLQEALESPSPDPTEVGQLTIDGRDLRMQLRDSREQLEETLKSFLTDEQIERWEAFEAARGPGRDRGFRLRTPRTRRSRIQGSDNPGAAL